MAAAENVAIDEADAETLAQMEQILSEGGNPSTKKLLEMLDSTNITDEMKENFKSMLTGSSPQVFGRSGGTFLAILFVMLIFSVILFFGYKLYKSIKEKELKREEKKKAKQMKKKK